MTQNYVLIMSTHCVMCHPRTLPSCLGHDQQNEQQHLSTLSKTHLLLPVTGTRTTEPIYHSTAGLPERALPIPRLPLPATRLPSQETTYALPSFTHNAHARVYIMLWAYMLTHLCFGCSLEDRLIDQEPCKMMV